MFAASTDKTSLKKWFLKTACICVLATLTGCGVIQNFNNDHAIGAMIAIRKAQHSFKQTKGRYGTLEELISSGLAVPTPSQYGYQFAIRADSTSFVAVAVPTRWKESSLSLYLDQSGVIKGMFKNGAEADVNDGPLKGDGINP